MLAVILEVFCSVNIGVRVLSESFRKVFKSGAILGLLLFVAIVTQTIGLNYIGGGRSAFISATYVLMVPLIIWLLRKIFPGWITLLAACMCVGGMFLLTGDEMSGTFNVGDLLTLVCAFTFAVQVIAIEKYTKDCDPIVLSFTEFVSFAVFALVSSLLFETRPELINRESLPELLFTIVLCTFGCYMIQICAQKYVKPARATIIMSLESVFGLLGSILWLGERVSLQMGIGCALIFAAVLIAELEPFIHIRS